MNANSRRFTRLVGFLAVPVFIASAGCGSAGRIVCVRYPDFWQSELKRVAVLPFVSYTGKPADGAYIAGRVQAALVQNGSYEVFTREQAHLAGIDSERVISLLNVGDYEEAKRIGRLTTVQALIVGTVNANGYTEHRERNRYEVPIYGKNAKGKQVVVGYRQKERTDLTIEAAVDGLVHVVDTGSGKLLASVPITQTGSNKSLDLGLMFLRTGPAILKKLQERAINHIISEVAVTYTRARLPAHAVRVATGRYDGEWEWEKKIAEGSPEFSVVVKLPEECARNHFRLTVVPNDSREVLVDKSFVCPEVNTELAFNFETEPIVSQNGYGPLTAKLYSGEFPIATYDFAIVRVGQ